MIGTLIYNPKTQDFETKKGPIFANFILRMKLTVRLQKCKLRFLKQCKNDKSPLVQHTYQLDRPFLVFATQNPIEQEGTYRLPEAQVDRFMFKLLVHYPNLHEERELLKRSLDVNQVHKDNQQRYDF